ncbi:MAG: hypothetical protein K2G24_06840 [Muribaculaceae bacterium]|nr:hypothetical protein [Muribaculaceae bacterium]
MIQFPDKTDCVHIPAAAVSDNARSVDNHDIRVVRCLNLRPGTGPEMRPVLKGVGQPRRLSDARLEAIGILPDGRGSEALVLLREPELFCLMPGESEPVELGRLGGRFLTAALLGNILTVSHSCGMSTVEWTDEGVVMREHGASESYHGISLRAEHYSAVYSTVASRRLQREYLPGETTVDGTDGRRLGADLGEAYERLCATARGKGCFVQPLLARYRVLDHNMNELYCSAPVLLSHSEGVQCTSTNYLRSLDRRHIESYDLMARTWRLAADIPARLPSEAAYVSVSVTPQFHPYNPSGAAAVSLSRSQQVPGVFAHITLPGADAALGSDISDGACAMLMQALGSIGSLERTVATFDIRTGDRRFSAICGATSSVRDEIAAIGRAVGKAAEPGDENLRRLSPPNRFVASRICPGPAAVLWSGLQSRRYGGYPVSQFAASVVSRAWEGWIKVDFADGSSVLWTGGASGSAPDMLTPVLSYPSADAVSMTINLRISGEKPRCQTFALQADPSLHRAVYIHDTVKPFALADAEGVPTEVPEVSQEWTGYGELLMLSPVESPLNPKSVYSPGRGRVHALAVGGGSQNAWDFGRSRFYAFCSGGILALTSSASHDRIAVTPVDTRECLSPDCVTAADGSVWAVASGDLVRLQGNRAITERAGCGYKALAWSSGRRELMGIRSDGTIELTSFDHGMSRFEMDCRLGEGKMYSPHGGLIAYCASGGIYNLADEGDSRMLDVELVVNFSHCRARATQLHAMVADMSADRFSGTVAVSRRNGERTAPSSDFGLIVRGRILTPVGGRMIARPALGWRMRLAGNATNLTISKIIFSYDCTGNT